MLVTGLGGGTGGGGGGGGEGGDGGGDGGANGGGDGSGAGGGGIRGSKHGSQLKHAGSAHIRSVWCVYSESHHHSQFDAAGWLSRRISFWPRRMVPK